MNIINILDSQTTIEEFTQFWIKNDDDFFDPFSKHVNICEYVKKILEKGHILIATNNEEIVGFICFYANDKKKREGHIQALLVSKSNRNKNIATSLLNKTISTMNDNGMKTCALTVDSENVKAKKLYEKYGFIKSKEININNNKQNLQYIINKNKSIDLKEVQNILLMMAKKVCLILKKNNIPYMITFGTLLGAVRHKGFIPWDDDFDIFLFSDTYDKAVEILRKELPTNMVLEDKKSEPLFFHAWAHVKDKNTMVLSSEYPHDNIYQNKGLSIDLYKATLMKECEVDLYRLKEQLSYIKRKERINLIDKKEAKKLEKSIRQKINEYKVDEKQNREAYAICLKERIMYPKEIFPLKKYKFEDTTFFGPNNYDSLLTRFYGSNYMQLPKKENQKKHYSVIERVN